MIYQLKPIFIEKLWGGRYYSKLDPLKKDKIGEVVLFSTHLDYPLIALTGNKETVLNHMNPELYLQLSKVFPITIKLIDAKEDLSIQVHPDDDYANTHHQTLGKEEYWMILEALENANVLIGHSIKDSKILKETVLNGQLHQHMNPYPIKQGDMVYIPANTVHAIQKNTRLIEIAQASILNFRVDDYQRLDTQGKLRELHIKEALDVMRVPDQTRITHFPKHLFHHEIIDVNRNIELNVIKDIAICVLLEGHGYIQNLEVNEGNCLIIHQEAQIQCDGNFKLMLIYSSLH